MILLNSWKNSLQLLKPANLKHFISDTLSILPQTYFNFLKFIPLIIILMAASLILYYYLIELPASHYVLLGVISILSSVTVLVATAIGKDAVNHEPFSFKKYRNHLIIGICILAFIFAFVLYFPMKGLVEFAQFSASSRLSLTELLSKKIEPYPELLHMRLKINLQLIGAMLVFIFVYINVFINLPGFIYLYFLDSQASIPQFFKAIYRGIKFLFYNLPGLIIIYGFFYILSVVIAYVLRDVDIHSLGLVAISVLALPLTPAINAELYKRLKV